jgi:hypothetical protein
VCARERGRKRETSAQVERDMVQCARERGGQGEREGRRKGERDQETETDREMGAGFGSVCEREREEGLSENGPAMVELDGVERIWNT